jgi:HEPN domain-containing protein
MLIDFDHAVGQWRHLLRDWLSVIAEGPTDFLELPVRGETRWTHEAYTNEIWSNYYDNLQRPQRVTRWQWEHVLAHIRAGDQPPLARVLLTTAKRAAATGNSRLAVIDAATAAEVALTAGLSDHLASEASPQVIRALIERTRMLGPRLDLARDLGMTLPDRIRTDLLERRNAVIHRGTVLTGDDAQAAIRAAGQLVDQCQPLAAHCNDPAKTQSPASTRRADRWDEQPPF